MTDADQESEEDVLRRMLRTPPKLHKALPKEGRNNGNRNRDHGGDKR